MNDGMGLVSSLISTAKCKNWVLNLSSQSLTPTFLYICIHLYSYFMKRYFTSWLSLNYPPGLSPSLKAFSWLLYSQKVLNILLLSSATILFPFITKPLKRVTDTLSALSHLSLLNPSVWFLSPPLYRKYALEHHWGHLIGKHDEFSPDLSTVTLLTSPSSSWKPSPTLTSVMTYCPSLLSLP